MTQNYLGRVTHVIAQAARGPFFEARKDKVDMISVEWLLECARQQTPVPLRPHHFMHLTHNTRMNVPNVCKYGDMYGCFFPLLLSSHMSFLATSM